MKFLNLLLVILALCYFTIFSACSVAEVDSSFPDSGHKDVVDGGCKEPRPFYRNLDRDSFGAGEAVMACENPSPEVYSSKGGDCNDNDEAIYPGALEMCDGRHNNCDELDAPDGRDEEPPLASRQEGVCEGLRQVCREGRWIDDYASVPGYGEEICDGLDNDCNPLTEDGRREEAPLTDSQEGICAGLHKVCQEGRWINNYERMPVYGQDICDKRDNNCDGKVDEGDVCGPICTDRDGDGYGFNCAPGLDCNDSNAAVYSLIYCKYDGNSCGNYNLCLEKCPAVPQEICDGKDNNCDGTKDEGCSCIHNEERQCGTTDKGECEYGKQKCVEGKWKDCEGNIESKNEICDYKDNNCDGQIDEGVKLIFYKDEDGDKFGNPDKTIEDCEVPEGYITNNIDCDDNEALKNPGLKEFCDGLDNNCDGKIDEGFNVGLMCDGIDTDFCKNGTFTCRPDGGDVECVNEAIKDVKEICDGIDNDCDESVDEDLGQAACGLGVCEHTISNCINGIPQICNPFEGVTKEVCDNLDNNCNGHVDEELTQTCYTGPEGTEDVGLCSKGLKICTDGDWGKCLGEVLPAPEACDNKDNNCDGFIDEENAVGCVIYYTDVDKDTYGVTGDKKCLCASSFPYTATRAGDCNDNDSSIKPGATEKCNNKDDNCNSQIDEENAIDCGIFYKDADSDNYGLNSDTKCLCSAVGSYKSTRGGDCDDQNKSINPGAGEICDQKDNNCNGKIDEGLIESVVAYYPLDGDGTDKSASHNDGTATTKVTSVEGALGPTSIGMHFEASCCSTGCSEGRIVAPNNPLLNFGGNSFTIMLWMKHKSVGDIVCGYGDVAFSYRQQDIGIMILMIDEEYPAYVGKPFMWLYAANGQECGPPVAGKRTDDGQWHHVAFVREGSRTVYAYIDGGLTATIDLGIDCVLANDITPPVTVGGFDLTGGASWNGELDELFVFSRALTAKEIQTYYDTGLYCGELTCIPQTCASLNYNCWPWEDGCGGTTGDCGACGLGQDCCFGTCGPNGCRSNRPCPEGWVWDPSTSPASCVCDASFENMICPAF